MYCIVRILFVFQSDFGRPTIDLGVHDIAALGYEVSANKQTKLV